MQSLTASEYTLVHQWVYKYFGKASQCEQCGDVSRNRYHWANISREYKRKRSDWRELCPSCHKKYDNTPEFRAKCRQRMLGVRHGLKPVMMYDQAGNLLRKFPSGRDAYNATGILQTSICNNLNGRAKSAGGYIWRYDRLITKEGK